MERIAPLAKILAEANGIEWQSLHGTGAGGQIVEQDILDYLSRVMSGEAEPPSTPVDAPPPDWNGEDVPGAGMFDVSALSRAGVDSDITDFVQQGRPAGTQTPPAPTPALASDDFELEDAPVAPQPVAAPAPFSPVAAAPAAPSMAAPSPVAPSPVAPAPVVPAPTPAPAAAGGLGSLLSRLYHKEEAPAPVPTPVPAQPEPAFPAPVTEAPTAPAFTAPVVPEPAASEPAFTAPTPVSAPERIAVPVAPAMSASAPAVPVEQTAAVAPAESAPSQTAPAQSAPAQPAAAQPVSTQASPAQANPVQANPVQAAAEKPEGAVWFGTYLRRSANVEQLSDLRAQLSEALEQDVPLGLLVARAAQRCADELGAQHIALQDVQAGEARSVGTGGLREALSASGQRAEGQPDVLVVDAGTLDLDDLHYPHATTLSVGRVDAGRVSLSLQGDVEPARAAQFLSAVAQLLEKPVILLV